MNIRGIAQLVLPIAPGKDLGALAQWAGNLTGKLGELKSLLVSPDTARCTFSAYLNSAQSIPTGLVSLTKILFDTVDFDSSGAVDTSGAKIVPKMAGVYLVFWGVQLSIFGAATLLGNTYKNGGLHARGITFGPATDAGCGLLGIDLVEMNGTTDYLEVYVGQNSGDSRNLLTGLEYTFIKGLLVK